MGYPSYARLHRQVTVDLPGLNGQLCTEEEECAPSNKGHATPTGNYEKVQAINPETWEQSDG